MAAMVRRGTGGSVATVAPAPDGSLQGGRVRSRPSPPVPRRTALRVLPLTRADDGAILRWPARPPRMGARDRDPAEWVAPRQRDAKDRAPSRMHGVVPVHRAGPRIDTGPLGQAARRRCAVVARSRSIACVESFPRR